MHIINNNKFLVNFEIIVLQVGLDVSQNPKAIIGKKKDASTPCKILVCKSENGDNIVVNYCIPLGNT